MAQPITMFTTSWCGYCKRLERQMDEAGIAFATVDIEAHGHHGDRIEAATGGSRTVPTLEIGGRLYVNPTIGQVKKALAGAD